MNAPRILIAGIGNIFFGDDAFGSEVARRLAARTVLEGVRVVDFGIRSFDLTYALLDGFDAAILVDATPRGGTPGTLYLIEPEPMEPGTQSDTDIMIDAHAMDPVKVLRLVASQGGGTKRILVLGCEPAVLGSDEDPVMGLSPPVEAAVDEAITWLDSLVAKLSEEHRGRVAVSGNAVP